MNHDLTPVAVVSLFASVVFGPQIAFVVGPYIVIGVGAMGGAAVMIMQRKGDGNVRAFVYFLASTALAVLFTVPTSLVAASMWEPIQAPWLFGPVAFGFGFLGDKWPAILAWCGSKISALVDALIAMKGQR